MSANFRENKSFGPELPELYVSIECTHCGTEIEFDTDRCPMCGTNLELPGKGIVGLTQGAEFEDDELEEMSCPFCGERTVMRNGICPQCCEAVIIHDNPDTEHLDPVIHTDNVVFLRLDVSSGEVSYVQRNARNRVLEQITVRLDEIGRAFAGDWKVVSRA